MLRAQPAETDRGHRARRGRSTSRKDPISAAAVPRTAASTGGRAARAVHDLVRAVAPPFPGAFTEVNGLPASKSSETRVDARAAALSRHGRRACTPRMIAGIVDCIDGKRLQILKLAIDETAARAARCAAGARESAARVDLIKGIILKNVLILGVNGFIGHHLSKYILSAHRLAHLRHGPAVRAGRHACSAIRAFTSSRATSPSTRSGSSTTCASAT